MSSPDRKRCWEVASHSGGVGVWGGVVLRGRGWMRGEGGCWKVGSVVLRGRGRARGEGGLRRRRRAGGWRVIKVRGVTYAGGGRNAPYDFPSWWTVWHNSTNLKRGREIKKGKARSQRPPLHAFTHLLTHARTHPPSTAPASPGRGPCRSCAACAPAPCAGPARRPEGVVWCWRGGDVRRWGEGGLGESE